MSSDNRGSQSYEATWGGMLTISDDTAARAASLDMPTLWKRGAATTRLIARHVTAPAYWPHPYAPVPTPDWDGFRAIPRWLYVKAFAGPYSDLVIFPRRLLFPGTGGRIPAAAILSVAAVSKMIDLKYFRLSDQVNHQDFPEHRRLMEEGLRHAVFNHLRLPPDQRRGRAAAAHRGWTLTSVHVPLDESIDWRTPQDPALLSPISAAYFYWLKWLFVDQARWWVAAVRRVLAAGAGALGISDPAVSEIARSIAHEEYANHAALYRMFVSRLDQEAWAEASRYPFGARVALYNFLVGHVPSHRLLRSQVFHEHPVLVATAVEPKAYPYIHEVAFAGEVGRGASPVRALAGQAKLPVGYVQWMAGIAASAVDARRKPLLKLHDVASAEELLSHVMPFYRPQTRQDWVAAIEVHKVCSKVLSVIYAFVLSGTAVSDHAAVPKALRLPSLTAAGLRSARLGRAERKLADRSLLNGAAARAWKEVARFAVRNDWQATRQRLLGMVGEGVRVEDLADLLMLLRERHLPFDRRCALARGMLHNGFLFALRINTEWHQELVRRADAVLVSCSAQSDVIRWPAILPTYAVGDLVIKPLVTDLELADEGARMRHCVSSYVLRSANGICQVFSVRTAADGTLSTVSLIPDVVVEADEFHQRKQRATLTIEQHRGYENSQPPLQCVEAVDHWLAWARETIRPEQIHELKTGQHVRNVATRLAADRNRRSWEAAREVLPAPILELLA